MAKYHNTELNLDTQIPGLNRRQRERETKMSLRQKALPKQPFQDGLEVVRDQAPALIYYHNDSPPEVLTSTPFKAVPDVSSSEEGKGGAKESRLICGFPLLWLIVAVISFIVGGALGGGVAAGVLSNNNKSSRYVDAPSRPQC